MYPFDVTYKFTTQLTHTEVLSRVSVLIWKKGTRIEGMAGTFDEPPGYQPYMLKRRKCFGIDPYRFTDFNVRCIPHDGTATYVFIEMRRLRQIFWAVWWVLMICILTRNLPLRMQILADLGGAIVVWLILVWLYGGYLAKRQIEEALAVVAPPND